MQNKYARLDGDLVVLCQVETLSRHKKYWNGAVIARWATVDIKYWNGEDIVRTTVPLEDLYDSPELAFRSSLEHNPVVAPPDSK